ncbi:hypothetical protein PINS_up007109 [Pythium insidiosum]|nr:hypothetical protein PINS_up007109 [Pythium insidiosum]
MTEDVLGELYGWDSTIDEVFERAQDDPEFDEDRALEAYEELIHMGGRTDAVDGVLSLAAQLLTKHFFKFPHVHMNVVDVLAALCGPKRPQAVRIHTIRSFLQIVKAPASEGTLSEPCRQRIVECVDELLASETSNVLQRNLQQLKKALDASTGDVAMTTPSARSPAAASTSGRDSKDAAQPQSSTPTSYDDRNNDRASSRDDYHHRDKESSSYRGDDRREDRREDRRVDRRVDRREDDQDDHRESRRDDRRESRREDRRDDRREDRREDREPRPSSHANDSGSNAPAPVSTSSANCPPGPYIFIGGVPRNATQEDIYDFLADVDPGISPASVQIKFPVRNQAGYSFVNMSSTRHARDAILFVKSTKYNGRLLIGDFARGPPCTTLRFVERRPGRTMYDDDAVRVLYFNEDDDARRLWSQLCEELHSYGDFDELRPGMIRFREADAAKAVIRRHHFVLAGREILPVYDHKEQQANDGTRRRQLAHGFALKSGRVVGGDERKDYRRHSRSQSPSRSNGYDDKRGRGRDDRDHRDRDVRVEEHHQSTRHRSSERGASDANNRSRRFSHREEQAVGGETRSHRDWEREQHDRERREPERRDLEPPKPRYNREPSPQRFPAHSHRDAHHDRAERPYNRDPEPRRDEFRGRRESPDRRRPSEDDRGRREVERRAPRSRSRSPRALQDRKAPPPPASPRFLNGRRSQSPQPMRRQERRRSPSPRDRMRDGNDSDTRSRRSSKGDDRSIAEIAREQQERQRQMQLQLQQQRGRHGEHDARHAHGHPPPPSSRDFGRYGAPGPRSRSRSPPPVMERERRRSPARRDSNSYNNNNNSHHNSSSHASSRYNDRAEPYQAHHQRRRSPSPQRQQNSWGASPDVRRQQSERRDVSDCHRGRDDRYRTNDSRRQPRDSYDDRRRHGDSHHRSEMAPPERSPAEQARLRSRTPSPTHQRQPDESPRRRYASRRHRSVSPSPSGETESSEKHYKRRRVEQEQDGAEPSGLR